MSEQTHGKNVDLTNMDAFWNQPDILDRTKYSTDVGFFPCDRRGMS